MKKEWFSEWFGSPYYPILYSNRDEHEAQLFIHNLAKHLDIPKQSKVLDLACGRGRHSIQLNNLGFEVRGWDISTESIEDANQFAKAHLQFKVLDMRHPFPEGEFDAIFNLFTSFGYFENLSENQTVLNNIAQALKLKGKLVLDFLNPDYVRRKIIPFEKKVIHGITFHIHKSIKNSFIYKDIHIIDKEKTFDFSEKVQLIEKQEFEGMFILAGLSVLEIWGEYKGSVYDSTQSSRLIFIGEKPV